MDGSPSKVQVYLSGYGPFFGVPVNATEELVKEIIAQKQDCEGPHYEFAALRVAEVSDKGAAEVVAEFYSLISKSKCPKSVVIHLGVDTSAS